MKSTNKHMKTWLIRFDSHRCLFESEEDKYM